MRLPTQAPKLTRLPNIAKTDLGKDVVWMGALLAVMLALFACGSLNQHPAPHGRTIPVVNGAPQHPLGAATQFARV